MHTRERGIGNTAFVLVLVVLVICIVGFVTQMNDNDRIEAARAKAVTERDAAIEKQTDFERAYKALAEVIATADLQLGAPGLDIAKDNEIRAKARAWLMERAAAMAKAGEFTMKVENYQVNKKDDERVEIAKTEGGNVTVRLFANPFTADTITVSKIFESTSDGYTWSGRQVKEAVEQFDATMRKNTTEVQSLKDTNASNQTTFKGEVDVHRQTVDSLTTKSNAADTDAQKVRADLDVEKSKKGELEQKIEQLMRKHGIEVSALQNRLKNELIRKDIDIKEDTADGEVVATSPTTETIWIDLGRRDKVAAGQKFRVWRVGKGGVREYTASIKVIAVEEKMSQARILETLNPRLPVAKGMSISNPFYSKTERTPVYVYGDLRVYTNDVAKRRLENAGCTVSPRLDDTVKIIILGEPSVAVEMSDDPTTMDANLKRAAVDRATRLEQVLDKARSIGAIVVTEDVLKTFVDY